MLTRILRQYAMLGVALLLSMSLYMGASTVSAAGMGSITVRSLLGQPLVADIELTIRDKRELEGLSARIASAEALRTAGVPNTTTMLGLKASIQKGKDSRSFIRVESVQPVTEPAMKLLIELSSVGTHTLREYNVLLEPPEVQRK